MAAELRAIALAYPETYEESPWGDRVVKVKGKIFFGCGVHQGKLHATVKVPQSGKKLLERKYAAPTHYGMGKYGWVTMTFDAAKDVPVKEMPALIRESFVSVAPKKMVEALGTDGARAAPEKKAPSSYAKAKKSAAARAKAKGSAILVCDDELRSGRAIEALAAAGVACKAVGAISVEKLGKAKALIVDLGRNPREGLALAEALDASDRAVHLFVCGVRDAEQARKLRGLGSAETFRAPPGDAEVVAAVAAALATASADGARRAR